MRQDLAISEVRRYLAANAPVDSIPRADRGILLYGIIGLVCLLFLFGGFAYWSITAKLDGAIVAQGSFEVESNRKTVQHLEGGIVRELLVKDGDFVHANQTLVRMDSTDSDVNIDVLGVQLSELYVRRTRLLAELAGADSFVFPVERYRIARAIDHRKLAELVLVQTKLFDAKKAARQREKAVVNQRIARFEQEISGLEQQRLAGTRLEELLLKDLKNFETLLKRQLIAESRVNGVKREIERLSGSDAGLVTAQTRAANQIEELKYNAANQKHLRFETLSGELADVDTRISSLEPQYHGVSERLKRIEVKAPVAGRVVDMKVFTQGAVIRSGEAILDIVPNADGLIVTARVDTKDIEKLRIGQETRVRLTAFDGSDIPEASGKLIDVSADVLTDDATGGEYYAARVRLDDKQTTEVASLDLIPGMPADVFFNTGARTAISYFLQPLQNRLARTFIE
ncbi:MAG: HlyD family type I secretion periplasmic adaptor subunit [Pseudomonadota bacterium]